MYCLYSAGALAAALFIVSGCQGMERGTISMDRDAEGNDVMSDWPEKLVAKFKADFGDSL